MRIFTLYPIYFLKCDEIIDERSTMNRIQKENNIRHVNTLDHFCIALLFL